MRPLNEPSSEPAVDPEQRWLEATFRGPERQLTIRAVLTGMLIGAVMCLSNLYVVLGTVPAGTPHTLDAMQKAGVPVFAYGNFITILVNFLILAFIIFLMVKQINRLKREAPPAPAAPVAPPEDIVLLREIRDSLKK